MYHCLQLFLYIYKLNKIIYKVINQVEIHCKICYDMNNIASITKFLSFILENTTLLFKITVFRFLFNERVLHHMI